MELVPIQSDKKEVQDCGGTCTTKAQAHDTRAGRHTNDCLIVRESAAAQYCFPASGSLTLAFPR